jgi:hypothetical protein
MSWPSPDIDHQTYWTVREHSNSKTVVTRTYPASLGLAVIGQSIFVFRFLRFRYPREVYKTRDTRPVNTQQRHSRWFQNLRYFADQDLD